MTKTKKPSPSKLKRSLNRLKLFNNMVMKAVFLENHYPHLDFRPVKNYFGGDSTYEVVWYHNYPEVCIAVLKEDPQLNLFIPDQTKSLFENLKKIKGMFDLECSDDYWKSLMRDLVRHNLEKKAWCGESCNNYPLCSTIYNIIKPCTFDIG